MIADDDERMRGVLRLLVAAAQGFELVAEAASGEGGGGCAQRAADAVVDGRPHAGHRWR
jgi:YesN/AraC family two-component response regulator